MESLSPLLEYCTVVATAYKLYKFQGLLGLALDYMVGLQSDHLL